jgi:hypothetical protein
MNADVLILDFGLKRRKIDPRRDTKDRKMDTSMRR